MSGKKQKQLRKLALITALGKSQKFAKVTHKALKKEYKLIPKNIKAIFGALKQRQSTQE